MVMSYSDSSKGVSLEGSTLRARLLRKNGRWCSASTDLNSVLGNLDGKLRWGSLFSISAKDLRLEGTVLNAQLQRVDGSWVSDAFDLRERLVNNDGVFEAREIPYIRGYKYSSGHASLMSCSSSTSLKVEDLRQKDGSWNFRTLSLNTVLGNIEGKFTWGKKYFEIAAKDLRLEGSVLKAQLQKSDGSWASDVFDLQNHIMDNDGELEPIMAYSARTRFLATGTAFDPEDNGVWTLADFNGDGSPDLVYIKTRNTDSGMVEVHVSGNESRFQDRTLSAVSVFPSVNGTFLMQDYTRDGKADLVHIKTHNTRTKRVEVYVASADSSYQQVVCRTKTCFAEEENGIWTLSDKADLIYIKTKNTAGQIEIHIASRSSNYQTLTLCTSTKFAVEDNGTWCVVSNTHDAYPDLYYIKTRGGVSAVEVHAVSASSSWQTRFIGVSSSFEPEENGHWLMSPLTHQEHPDLVYIKTRKTKTKQVEIHAVASKPYTRKTYVNSSKNVLFDGSVVRAQLQRIDGSWRSASIILDMILGNIEGKFSWGGRWFSKSAQDVRLEGAVLKAQLQKKNRSWAYDAFNLGDYLMNNDGVFQAVEVPVIIPIPVDQEKAIVSQLTLAMKHSPYFVKNRSHLQMCEEPDGTTIFYAMIGKFDSDGIFLTCSAEAEAKASIIDITERKGVTIEQVSVDVLSAKLSAWTGTNVGIGATIMRLGGKASCLDFNYGIGVTPPMRISCGSIKTKAAGCGFQIGQKVSLSFFKRSVGIDFARFFDLFALTWTTRNEWISDIRPNAICWNAAFGDVVALKHEVPIKCTI